MRDLDDMIRGNLRRLIDSHGIRQNELAARMGVHPSVINDLLGGRIMMGKSTMMRICKALQVEPWEFYWTEGVPIVRDAEEWQALQLFRRAKASGVSLSVERFAEYEIQQAESTHVEDIDDRLRRGRQALKEKTLKRKSA